MKALFVALNEIAKQDPTFDFACRAAICGPCAMLINGRPGLVCKTLTRICRFTLCCCWYSLIGDLSVLPHMVQKSGRTRLRLSTKFDLGALCQDAQRNAEAIY